MTVKEKMLIARWLEREGAKVETNPPRDVTTQQASAVIGALLYELNRVVTS